MIRANEIILERVSRLGKLSQDDREALRTLPIERASLDAFQDLVRVGDRPSRSILILSGLAATYKDTSNGRRQIHVFQRAGDMPDLYSLHLTTLDASIGTLTPCEVGFVRHDHLRQLCERHYRIAAALWRSTLIDASIAREWMTNLGQRQALARMAHLFCEQFVRSDVAGLAEPGPRRICPFPVSQSVLGEALGLSVVHVNRTLQQLRDDRLIGFENGRLEILDWNRLADFAGFDPTYLHLDDELSKRYAA